MSIRFVKLFLSLLAICSFSSSYSQTIKQVYTKASDLTFIGKLSPTQNVYHRLDTAKYSDLPSAVKRLLTNSAGIAISFKTNSTSISAKWCVTDKKQSSNLTAIANKGLDLYIKRNGVWQFAGVGRPSAKCTTDDLVKNMVDSEKECLLYLPLYDEISNLEIGVDEGSKISPAADPFKKRIVIYGSSIVQGASASRPGLAYPAWLSRETSINFLNLGLSGSAKMEKAAAEMVASLSADAFILDCVPNSTPEQITERTNYLVSTIRKSHPKTPIIIIQSIVREHGFFDQKVGKTVKEQNENIEKEFRVLQQSGMKDIYFIPSDNLLGNDHEGTVDGTHPNDIGFSRMLDSIKPQVMAIFKKYGI